ncbi:MAG: hypothetical protein HY271_07730 [Deltaproteobacteria bacterium]|nr:hypothetical protein [Deltaproteobacteria bacterium]
MASRRRFYRKGLTVLLVSILFPASAQLARADAENVRAKRVQEIVKAHFFRPDRAACAGTCSLEETIAALDPHSRLITSGAPSLDFIRGLSSDTAPPEMALGPEGQATLRIPSFGRRTGRETLAALKTLPPELTKVSVDLRGNRGGILESALQIAGAFTPAGAPLVEIVERSGVRRFRSDDTPKLPPLPLEVLVDGRTASSAEVLAWLLRWYAGAKVVGSRTAGKGTVQEVYRVDPHTRLLLTVGVYRLPDGRTLDGIGVSPDRSEVSQ